MPAATILRDQFGFDMLAAETAVDYYPQTTPRFHMVYIFYSTTQHIYLNFRAGLHGRKPHHPNLGNCLPQRQLARTRIMGSDGHQV